MTKRKLAGMAGVMALLAGIVLHGSSTDLRAREDKADDLPSRAYAILKTNCAKCHSKDAKKLKAKLDMWNAKHLLDPERKIVVPGKPDKSELIARLRAEDETSRMPPKGPLSDADVKVLTEWVASGAKPVSIALTNKENDAGKNNKGKNNKGKNAANNGNLASQVKELFRTRCFECHGGTRTSAGIKILDHALLLDKGKVVPGKADDSPLYQLVSAKDESVMPPTGQPRLDPDSIDLVRRWIAAGAPAYPADVIVPLEKEKDNSFKDVAGVDYVLKKILAHVRDQAEDDRPFIRYISINHILTAGATPAELEMQRNALAKALNHLTWEPDIAPLQAIDSPTNTVYAIDLRKYGWNKYPYKRYTYDRKYYDSKYNVFDMILLDYPYGIYYQDSDTFDRVVREYMYQVKLIRPIPYIRGDWFVSTVTQPPLYEDVLALPFHVTKLEKEKLGVYVEDNIRDYKAKRAGMTVSGVSRNNRVVERHPSKYGFYWKSYDFRSSKGKENMFKDPIDLNPTGGEFIFTLPNKLQGYYVANAKGERLELAPTDIVTDKFADDKTVRNGLACMRCHDSGMKGFTDTVRPALDSLMGTSDFDKRTALALYIPQKQMDGWVKKDGAMFVRAMEQVLGKPQKEEPLIPVSRRYLDAPIHLSAAAGELGYADGKGLETVFRTKTFTALGLIPLAAQGVVRRDAWEDYYDQAVRALGTGTPIVPIDGTRKDYQAPPVSSYVELKTNKKGNTFTVGDELVIFVENKSERTIYVEMVGTGTKGRKQYITPGVIKVAPYKKYRYPAEGKVLKIDGQLGKEQITVYASYKYFAPGEILRGKDMTDRFVHPFYRVGSQNRKLQVYNDAYSVAKKTIEIETR